MFREWYRCLAAGGFADEAARTAFAGDLKRYAFFPDLRAAIASRGADLESLIGKGEDAPILKSVLTEEGLNYGCLPKALLKFHAYPEGSRTALEEHLVEAALYARDAENVSRVHFTVSREHESAVRTLLSRVIRDYESRLDTVFAVGISTQDPATDTIAVDPENRPFRDDRGKPVFRPGGHGSLLRNLNLLDEEIIFLKNIDNTVPDRLKTETSLWKKLLAGCLIRLQEEIFASVRLLAGGRREEELERMRDFAEKRVNIGFPTGFRELSLSERRSFFFRKLNRPLRVCGMVKNEGEPGGGPFWVEDADGMGVPLCRSSRSRRLTGTTRNSVPSGRPPRTSTPSIWSAASGTSKGGNSISRRLSIRRRRRSPGSRRRGGSFSRWNGPVCGTGRWPSGTPSSLRFRYPPSIRSRPSRISSGRSTCLPEEHLSRLLKKLLIQAVQKCPDARPPKS